VALGFLPQRQFDPIDIILMENLVAANGRKEGLTIFIHRMSTQPFEQPALRFAECGGRFGES
jgi:hypothetical protein